MYKSRLSQNEYKFNFLHFSSNFLNISNEYNIQSLLEIQCLSDLEISNINGNQRTFPFKIASITMISDDFSPLVVSLSFSHDNHCHWSCYHNK